MAARDGRLFVDWGGYVIFNLELHGGDDEVTATGGSDGRTKFERVSGNFFVKGVGYVAGY